MNIYQAFKDDLIELKCSCGSTDELYDLDGDIWCKSCLINAEYEEPERGLTLEERNK